MMQQQEAQEMKSNERETKQFKNDKYTPLHADLFQFNEKFLAPTFLQAVQEAKALKPLMLEVLELQKNHSCENFAGSQEEHDKYHAKLLQFNTARRTILGNLLEVELPNVYSLDIFTQEFCEKLIAEAKNFEKMCNVKLRPNSMNNYGLVIDEMGLSEFFDTFITQYFTHVASIMNKNSFDIDDHHTFIVEYAIGKDKELHLHVDDAELTLNICLGVDFTGGNILFKGHIDNPQSQLVHGEYEHIKYRAILHDGRHMHAAAPIDSGERYNLIIWCRSSAYRAQQQVKQQKL